MSARNGSALLDHFSVNCPLWTTADQDLLPVSYSFLVDIGTGNELLLRDSQHAPYSTDLILPSSRVTIKDEEYGWMLCRHFCPVKFVTDLQDVVGAKTQWRTTLYLRRPGCEDKVAPCKNAVMLDIIDTALRSVDVFAADMRATNALMLLLAFELSDLDLFAVNGTVAYDSHFADLRARTSGQVCQTCAIATCLHCPLIGPVFCTGATLKVGRVGKGDQVDASRGTGETAPEVSVFPRIANSSQFRRRANSYDIVAF